MANDFSAVNPFRYLQNQSLYEEFHKKLKRKIFENIFDEGETEVARKIVVLSSFFDPQLEPVRNELLAQKAKQTASVIEKVMSAPVPNSSQSLVPKKTLNKSSLTILPPSGRTKDGASNQIARISNISVPKVVQGNLHRPIDPFASTKPSVSKIEENLPNNIARLTILADPKEEPIAVNPPINSQKSFDSKTTHGKRSSKTGAAHSATEENKEEREESKIPFGLSSISEPVQKIRPSSWNTVQQQMRAKLNSHERSSSMNEQSRGDLRTVNSSFGSEPNCAMPYSDLGLEQDPIVLNQTSALEPIGIIRDPDLFHQAIGEALCLRYLSPKEYKKLFKNKNQRKIVGQLIELYLAMRLQALGGAEKSLSYISAGNDSSVIRGGLNELINSHGMPTIDQMPEAFKNVRKETKIPAAFNDPPFNNENSIKDFVSSLLCVKYQCLALYKRDYREDEKWMLNTIFRAYALSIFLSCGFKEALSVAFKGTKKKKALSFLLPKKGIVNETVKSLVLRANHGRPWEPEPLVLQQEEEPEHPSLQFDELEPLAPKEGPVTPEKQQINRILQFHSFKNEKTFKAIIDKIDNIKKELNKADKMKQGYVLSPFLRLFVAIWNRIRTEQTITLEAALKNSFTPKSLQHYFSSEDLATNVNKCLEELRLLDPPPQNEQL